MSVVAVPYHTDDPIEDFVLPVPPDEVLTQQLTPGSPWHRMGELYATVAENVAGHAANGTRPFVMSGDCTTSLGIVAGLQRALPEQQLGVVWFDAHGDIHSPETTMSGYLGGLPLRMLLGTGDKSILDRLALRAIPEDQTVLVDARDLDPPEAEFLASSKVRRAEVTELRASDLPTGPLYLHIDVDVIDSGELPGLLYPTPEGPSLQEVLTAALTVLDTGRVAAVGLGCTWHPERADSAAVLTEFAEDIIACLQQQ